MLNCETQDTFYIGKVKAEQNVLTAWTISLQDHPSNIFHSLPFRNLRMKWIQLYQSKALVFFFILYWTRVNNIVLTVSGVQQSGSVINSILFQSLWACFCFVNEFICIIFGGILRINNILFFSEKYFRYNKIQKKKQFKLA